MKHSLFNQCHLLFPYQQQCGVCFNCCVCLMEFRLWLNITISSALLKKYGSYFYYFQAWRDLFKKYNKKLPILIF